LTANRFKDLPVKERQGWHGEVCPKCEGHGEWNLSVNCYPEQEGKFRHFRMACTACGGSGYLRKDQTCAHEWGKDEVVGHCLHKWTCLHCGETKLVDSGD